MKNFENFFDRENFDLKIAKHKSPIMRLKIPKSTKDEKRAEPNPNEANYELTQTRQNHDFSFFSHF